VLDILLHMSRFDLCKCHCDNIGLEVHSEFFLITTSLDKQQRQLSCTFDDA